MREELETEETVEPKEEAPTEEVAAEPETVEPEAPEEVVEPETVEAPEEEPPAKVAEEEKPPVEALPNIFVSDSSTPPRSLAGPRTLIIVDEKKNYPMNAEVNTWVREHDIPIKVPTPELIDQINALGLTGQAAFPDLTELTKKLGD